MNVRMLCLLAAAVSVSACANTSRDGDGVRPSTSRDTIMTGMNSSQDSARMRTDSLRMTGDSARNRNEPARRDTTGMSVNR